MHLKPGSSFPVLLPPAQPGMRIGLYGGSFNPPHDGHRLVSQLALKNLGLDHIWWVVTPGNPLKSTSDLESQEQRMNACRQIAANPRVKITGFERELGVRYTLDTLEYLVKRHPKVSFIWIMGADSLMTFHLWRGWQKIAHLMPIAIIDRPNSTLKATQSKAAYFLKRYRLPSFSAHALYQKRPPHWVYIYGSRSHLSSTVLRAQNP